MPRRARTLSRPREKDEVLNTEFQGRAVPMTLTHGGVVAAAKDWQTFSSDALMRHAQKKSREL